MPHNNQQGSILVLTLLMLLFVQIVAVAMVNSVNISSHVLRNFATTIQVQRSADNLINYLLVNKDYFVNYSNYLNQQGEFELSVPSEIVAKPAIGRIARFICLDGPSATANSASRVCGINSQYWQIVVEVTNEQTGAGVKVNQGIKLLPVTVGVASAQGSLAPSQQTVSAVQARGIWWYLE